ncbi:probable G-protein coupled receptor 148 [Leuresthes tenuis]|uniref:probable G-protein coupled receptor 148 n=1 Tax=Leuresthes tenuis TaxID=355514 RepID=UPI003B5003F5
MISNLTQEWYESVRRWHLELFCIPATLLTLATMLASPVLLICIFVSRSLRQETRYLLVANTLTADMVFLVLNLAIIIGNAAGAEMPFIVCELSTAVLVTSYSCAILTVTLMVADTFTAVRWPLHYHDVMTPGRTHCIMAAVWVLAALYPFSLMILGKEKWGNPREKVSLCLAHISFNTGEIHTSFFFVVALICAFLILYCYIRLYMVTRTQGIWHNRFSRARVTVLAHGVLLLLYFAPGFVFILELYMFQTSPDNFQRSRDVHVWVSTVNNYVLMLLPRAFAPYLYGLRYREIADTLTLLLHRHRRLGQIT